jgi:PAS domain S-box-containing protein
MLIDAPKRDPSPDSDVRRPPRLTRAVRGALANALGRRVIAWILLSSCIIALVSAVAQLYALYHREVAQIESSLDALEHSSLAGLEFAVWNFDQPQIEAQLAGLRALPDVSYVAVRDSRGRTLAESGQRPKDAVVRRFPIIIERTSGAGAVVDRTPIGELTVQATLDGVYGRLGNEALTVLASESTKTFVGALVMLLIFRHLVSRPLSELAKAAGDADVARLGHPIAVHRVARAPDDFDTLVSAMNRMRASLKHEVDELQSARDALAASEYRYRSLIESTNVVAWEMHATSGRMTFVGPQVSRVLGYASDDWREKGFSAATVDDLDLPSLQAALTGPSDRLDVECRLVTVDNERRWASIFAERRTARSGEAFWHGHMVDIDARKRSEIDLARHRAELEIHVAERTAELREKVAELEQRREEQARLFRDLETARNQAIQSEKLASIGQLAAGVAHEINNPVGFVLSNFGSLERYVDDIVRVLAAYEAIEPFVPAGTTELSTLADVRTAADIEYVKDDVRHLLVESRDGLDRVRRIVQDLKDFAHAGEAHWQRADLVRGLESTLNVVRNEIKYKAEVVKRYQSLPDVDCMPSQLNQVFMNLLVNAAHAIADHGTITVACGTQDDEVWVEITDTGCGMTPEVAERVFDPFFTTKPVGQGTGLGLSVSYSIVKRHGGRIEVASAPGYGTTFRIWLPIHRLEPETAQAS